MKLKAVQDQRKRCDKWKHKFSKVIKQDLMNMIIHVGNDTDNLESGLGNQSADLKLSRRQNIHRELVSYAELVHWLKSMDPPTFEGLQSTYRASMRKLYDKDLRRFFESARFRVSGTKSPGGGLLGAGSTQELANKKKANQAGLLGKKSYTYSTDILFSTPKLFQIEDVSQKPTDSTQISKFLKMWKDSSF